MGRLSKNEREIMKIQFDHQIFTSQRYGGISRYFYELMKEFDKLEGIETNTSLLLSNNYYISDKKIVDYMEFLPNTQFRGKQRLLNLFNKTNTIFKLQKQNFDIFHPTYYDPYFFKYIGSKPFVLTVYDMIHEKFSELFPEHDVTTQNKKLLVKKASKVIAISQSTKNDLIDLFDVEPSKIEVVYLGNSMHLENDVKLSIDIPKKYILFVGSRSGYKNFNRFIKSIAQLLNTNIDLCVICVGGGCFNVDEIALFDNINIKNKVFQYDLDDKSLAQFYKQALMFVFPSLYEGFGMPILEAFACACPLVCSKTSSLPEIAGNGAHYFDPYKEESISNAIQKVLEDGDYRRELIKNGTTRLKLFSWQQTAIDTKKVYEGVMK